MCIILDVFISLNPINSGMSLSFGLKFFLVFLGFPKVFAGFHVRMSRVFQEPSKKIKDNKRTKNNFYYHLNKKLT